MAKLAARKAIPRRIQAEVLVRCRRRCALCLGLDGDLSEKAGQIAHIDRDPNNNELSNLCYLCLPHHDQYDARTSQSKGLTESEVIRYRDELVQLVRAGIPEVPPDQAESAAGERAVLTASEAAQILRVDEDTVLRLIDSGDLAALRLGSSWRVLTVALVDFLRRGMKKQQLAALERALVDPKTWAKSLKSDPQFEQEIRDGEYGENTMGRFLQKALSEDT